VKFTGSPEIGQVREDLGELGITLDRDYREVGVYRIRIGPQAAGEQALAQLQRLPAVEYVEPDYPLRIAIEPDDGELPLPEDELFRSQWALHNTGQLGGSPDADIDAPEAWESATPLSPVVVAVIDTGVDHTHPDLINRMWTNPDEIPGNGRDDDHNGYVDDMHGINTITRSGDPVDDNGHGTHCAGIIAAERDNDGIGIAGVGEDVQIMALKFLDASGSGSTSDAIEAINYAVAEKKKGSPVRVISASWGNLFYSRTLYKAIFTARSHDILFVTAAGNYGRLNDIHPFYPASYPQDNIIAVAATDDTDHLAPFSSYGSRTVDLAAPGVSIISTVNGGGYAMFSGTSMAAPHVAGVAALLFGQEPEASFLDVKKRILSGVDRVPSLGPKVASGGRLNAYGALTAPQRSSLPL
jgi:subtilisin family serine protease